MYRCYQNEFCVRIFSGKLIQNLQTNLVNFPHHSANFISGLVLSSFHFPALKKMKMSTWLGGWRVIFHLASSFTTADMLLASAYTITISMANLYTCFIPYFYQSRPSHLGPVMPRTQRKLFHTRILLISMNLYSDGTFRLWERQDPKRMLPLLLES